MQNWRPPQICFPPLLAFSFICFVIRSWLHTKFDVFKAHWKYDWFWSQRYVGGDKIKIGVKTKCGGPLKAEFYIVLKCELTWTSPPHQACQCHQHANNSGWTQSCGLNPSVCPKYPWPNESLGLILASAYLSAVDLVDLMLFGQFDFNLCLYRTCFSAKTFHFAAKVACN